MVNFDPPARKALPDAEIYRILSEIPADSEGMERAANLMGEQERLREEDERAYLRWLEDLKSDGSAEAQATLAALFPKNSNESVEKVVPEEPAVLTPEEPAVLTPEEPAVLTPEEPAVLTPEEPAELTPEEPAVPAVPALDEDFPEVRTQGQGIVSNRESFESLITGSQPIAVAADPVAAISAQAPSRALSWLHTPIAILLAVAISAPASGLNAVVGLGGGALLGALAFLLASRGAPADLGAMFTASFGVIAGRIVVAVVALVTVLWVLLVAGELNWNSLAGSFDLSRELFDFTVSAIAIIAIALGFIRARWFAYLLVGVSLGAAGLLISTSSFAVPAIGPVASSVWLFSTMGFAVGFLTQSSAIQTPRRGQFVFAPVFAVLVASAGFLAAAISVPTDVRLAVAALAVVALIYFVASRLLMAARESSINRIWVVIGLVVAVSLLLLPIEAGVQYSLIAVFAAIGVAAADGALRSLPLHTASTRRPFGFYGAASSSAILVWLLASAGTSLLAILFGLSAIGPTLVTAPSWVTEESVLAVALVSGLLLGLLRIRAVRSRELDQESASGNQPLQNLLGL